MRAYDLCRPRIPGIKLIAIEVADLKRRPVLPFVRWDRFVTGDDWCKQGALQSRRPQRRKHPDDLLQFDAHDIIEQMPGHPRDVAVHSNSLMYGS